MSVGPSKIDRIESPDRLLQYQIYRPHPPEIPAFERGVLNFQAMEPPGEVNSETIPLMILFGLGEYGASPYRQSLFSFLTKRMNVLPFAVDFLGTKSFKPDGFAITDRDIQVTVELLSERGYQKHLPSLSPETDNAAFIEELKKLVPLQKAGQQPPACSMTIDAFDDHFDYCLIQVIDCLWSIQTLRSNYPNANWKCLTSVGSSQGASVANQCMRFAPNTFSLSLNHLGGIRPPKFFIQPPKVFDRFNWDGVEVFVNRHDFWSKDSKHPCYLSEDRLQIRTLFEPSIIEQWRKQTEGSGPLQFYTHTVDDEVHPKIDKENYIQLLRSLDFDVEYISSEPQKIEDFKMLHFILANFKKERFSKNPASRSDFERKSQVVYECQSSRYTIDFTQEFPVLTAKSVP